MLMMSFIVHFLIISICPFIIERNAEEELCQHNCFNIKTSVLVVSSSGIYALDSE